MYVIKSLNLARSFKISSIVSLFSLNLRARTVNRYRIYRASIKAMIAKTDLKIDDARLNSR
ncbi:hypothetical protein CAMSH0001_2116 [Campylobacter showae RM3277]|uniref:Uncharacterized protein n=1 Tax=Campylobacter showae RM3277 TaxID=553219 RepID=C6REM4_9BACT|nr:hypothetical protein CAMSH0001_2116 [Campylobacter showae RM3277]